MFICPPFTNNQNSASWESKFCTQNKQTVITLTFINYPYLNNDCYFAKFVLFLQIMENEKDYAGMTSPSPNHCN